MKFCLKYKTVLIFKGTQVDLWSPLVGHGTRTGDHLDIIWCQKRCNVHAGVRSNSSL